MAPALRYYIQRCYRETTAASSASQTFQRETVPVLRHLRYSFSMASPEQRDLDFLFNAFCAGDVAASNELLNALYQDLRRLAQVIFQDASSGNTLQATALVNEAWLRLADSSPEIKNRHHFFALAARAMRYVLADHAKGRLRKKRGGDRMRVTLTSNALAIDAEGLDLVAFHDALEQLGSLNGRMSRVAELRLLGTLSPSEIADVIGVSERTVKRDWQFARIWLTKELRDH